MTLFRPVGRKELDLIAESGFRRFPPRLSHQPIFYPVVTEAYAIEIARAKSKTPATRPPVTSASSHGFRFARATSPVTRSTSPGRPTTASTGRL